MTEKQNPAPMGVGTGPSLGSNQQRQPPTIDALAQALDQLVTALVQHRNARAVDYRPIELTSMATLLATGSAVLRARDLADHPVECALKGTMREIGHLLFDRLGTTDALLAVAEQVCDRDPNNWNRRMSPIDSAFNGVGCDGDRWWT